MSAAFTVHVNDASRAVGVVGALLSPQTRDSYAETLRAEYRKVGDPRMRAANSTRRACRSPRRAPMR